ncbi:hypothetical protein NFI96_010931, partial [Prochilodus magdalenae]
MRAGQKRRSTACVLALLPHAALILSLIVYALLGAALFSAIEGRSDGDGRREEFMRNAVVKLRNVSALPENATLDVLNQILMNYSAELSQSPDRWHFYGSLFFCCTVFSTVGEVLLSASLSISPSSFVFTRSLKKQISSEQEALPV